MAGGLGTRFGEPEKALVKASGKPLIGRLIDEARNICDEIFVSIDPSMVNIKNFLGTVGVNIIAKNREGYVIDLNFSLNSINTYPILVLSADLYFKDPSILRKFTDMAMGRTEDIITFTLHGNPIGISLFKKPEGDFTNIDFDDGVVNVNTIDDLKKIQ